MPDIPPLVPWRHMQDTIVRVRSKRNRGVRGSPNEQFLNIQVAIVSCWCPHCNMPVCVPWTDIEKRRGELTTYTCMCCEKDFRFEYGEL